jgi:hypothetical protein
MEQELQYDNTQLVNQPLNEFQPPYNLELREMGVWDTIDFTFDWMKVLYLASDTCNYFREENIRIMDNDGKII